MNGYRGNPSQSLEKSAAQLILSTKFNIHQFPDSLPISHHTIGHTFFLLNQHYIIYLFHENIALRPCYQVHAGPHGHIDDATLVVEAFLILPPCVGLYL